MYVAYSKENNPFYNLALEELLLKNYKENFVLIYRNASSVIIGKHQIPYCETNIEYLTKNNINIARRLSGGGTVYHDKGNINFSFIVNVDGKINSKDFTKVIISFLKTYNIDACANKRNDILINGKKISGNAEHIYKNRIIHHGTLLYDSDKNILQKALSSSYGRYRTKAVRSVRSTVCNIKEELKLNTDTAYFENLLLEFLYSYYERGRSFRIYASDKKKIIDLINKKYSCFDWTFLYSPDYCFSTRIETPEGCVDIGFEVKKLEIHNVNIKGGYLKKEFMDILTENIHYPAKLRARINRLSIKKHIRTDKLVWSLF